MQWNKSRVLKYLVEPRIMSWDWISLISLPKWSLHSAKCDILAFVTWNKKEVISPYSNRFPSQNRLNFILGANPGPTVNWFINAAWQDHPLDNTRNWLLGSSGSRSGRGLPPREHLAKSGAILGCHSGGGNTTGICWWRPQMLQNTQQSARQSPTQRSIHSEVSILPRVRRVNSKLSI